MSQTVTDEQGRVSAYPLTWPRQLPRTRQPLTGPFSTAIGAARDGLLRELELLGAKNPILSSNLPLKKDGQFYAREMSLADTGVAVYFHYLGEQRVLACDRWRALTDNVQALRKTVEALRGLERWGSSDILRGTFTGLKALPPGPPAERPTWPQVLGLPLTATEVEVRRRARHLLAELLAGRTGLLSPAELEQAQQRVIDARGQALDYLTTSQPA